MPINIYKQILIIELKDGTILRTKFTKEQLKAYIEECPFVMDIDDVLFNKFEFKKAYEEKLWSIDSHILSKAPDAQKALRIREKEKMSLVGRWFDTVQEIENYLKQKWFQ